MGVFQGYNRWNLAGAPAPPISALRTDDDEKQLQFEVLATNDPKKRAQLTEQLAWVRLRKGDFAGARRAVNSVPGFAPSTSLKARLAATENDVDKVIELLEPAGAASETDRPLLLSALIAKERFDDA